MSSISTPTVSVNPNIDMMAPQVPIIEYQAGQYFPPNLIQYEQLNNVLQSGVQAANSFLDFVKNSRQLSEDLRRQEILKWRTGLAEAKRQSAELSLIKMREERRPDGTMKSEGWVPGLTNSQGKPVTEYSIEVDGRLVPAINPYLTKDELDEVVRASESGAMPSDEIIRKSVQFANDRELMGDSLFPQTMYQSSIEDPSQPLREYLNSIDPEATIDEIRIELDEEKTRLIYSDIEGEQARLDALRKNNADIIAYTFSTYLRQEIFEFADRTTQEQNAMLRIGNDPDRVLDYLKSRIPTEVMNRLNSVDKFEKARLEETLKGDITWFMSQMDDIRTRVRKEESYQRSSANLEVATNRLSIQWLNGSMQVPPDGVGPYITPYERMENEREQFYAVQDDLGIGIKETDAGWADLLRRTSVNLQSSGSSDNIEMFRDWLESQDRISGDTKKAMITELNSAISAKSKAEIEGLMSEAALELNYDGVLQVVRMLTPGSKYERQMLPADFEAARARGWETVRATWKENASRLNSARMADILTIAESETELIDESFIVDATSRFLREIRAEDRNVMKDESGNAVIDPSGQAITAFTAEDLLRQVGSLRGDLVAIKESRGKLNTAILTDAVTANVIKSAVESSSPNYGAINERMLSEIRKRGIAPNSIEEGRAKEVLNQKVQTEVFGTMIEREVDTLRNRGFTFTTLNRERGDPPDLVRAKAEARSKILYQKLLWDMKSGNTTTIVPFRNTLEQFFSASATERPIMQDHEDAFQVYLNAESMNLNMVEIFGTSDRDKQFVRGLEMVANKYREGNSLQNALADVGQYFRLEAASADQMIVQLATIPDQRTRMMQQEDHTQAWVNTSKSILDASNKERRAAGLETTVFNTDGLPYGRMVYNKAVLEGLTKTFGNMQASIQNGVRVLQETTVLVDGSFLPKEDFGELQPSEIRALAKFHAGGQDAIWVVTGYRGQEAVYALRRPGKTTQFADPNKAPMAFEQEGDWISGRTYTIREMITEQAAEYALSAGENR